MVQWMTDNWVAVAAALGAFLVLARIVVKMTPTKADDAVVERLSALEKTLKELFDKAPSIAPTEALEKNKKV